jgi:hypothetical protein
MRANDPNLPDLRRVAAALGDLRAQLVFLGGAVAGLLVTDLTGRWCTLKPRPLLGPTSGSWR